MLVARLTNRTTLTTLAIFALSAIGILPQQTIGQTASEGKPSLASSTKDIAAFQGVWRLVSSQTGAHIAATQNAVLMVRGNRACWEYAEEENQFEGGLYLDSTTTPKAYDFVTSSRTFEGIYSLEGDTLKLCYDLGTEAKRPGEFSAPRKGQRVLMTLKREKGVDISDFRLPDGSRAFPGMIERPAKPIPAPRPANVPQPPTPARKGSIQSPPSASATPPVPQIPQGPVPARTTPGPLVPPPGVTERPARVGQIIIVGNEKTPDAAIRKHIPFFPGEVLRYPTLREAEKKLADLKLFVVDPKLGIRPTVTVLDDPANPNEYKDILVNVVELQPKTKK